MVGLGCTILCIFYPFICLMPWCSIPWSPWSSRLGQCDAIFNWCCSPTRLGSRLACVGKPSIDAHCSYTRHNLLVWTWSMQLGCNHWKLLNIASLWHLADFDITWNANAFSCSIFNTYWPKSVLAIYFQWNNPSLHSERCLPLPHPKDPPLILPH